MIGVRLRVQGDYALFTRPENKGERCSYDVPTPSAMRGILEAIHWKPAIRWLVDRIHVLNPIVFDSIRRNEVSEKGPSVKSVKNAAKNGIFAYKNRENDVFVPGIFYLRICMFKSSIGQI